METLPRRLLHTDAGRAAAAQAWVDGTKQRDIARAFGFRKAVSVSVAVLELVETYVPESGQGGYWPWGDDRRPLAALAVQRYLRSRAQPPGGA